MAFQGRWGAADEGRIGCLVESSVGGVMPYADGFHCSEVRGCGGNQVLVSLHCLQVLKRDAVTVLTACLIEQVGQKLRLSFQ